MVKRYVDDQSRLVEGEDGDSRDPPGQALLLPFEVAAILRRRLVGEAQRVGETGGGAHGRPYLVASVDRSSVDAPFQPDVRRHHLGKRRPGLVTQPLPPNREERADDTTGCFWHVLASHSSGPTAGSAGGRTGVGADEAQQCGVDLALFADGDIGHDALPTGLPGSSA